MSRRRRSSVGVVLCAAAAVSLTLACAEPAPSGPAAPADPAARFVGSWSLESWTTAEGEPRCGDAPLHGQIQYTADGHMSAQLGCRPSAPDPEAVTPDDTRGQLTRRHFSYYGAFTVDPDAGTVTHHVQGSVSPSWIDEDRVRSYIFESDDRLVLDAGGTKLVWVRAGR